MNDKTNSANPQAPATEAVDENHIIAERREKLAKLRSNGVAFPNDFVPTHLAADLHAHYDSLTKEELAAKKIHVKVAGRMVLKRVMGKASFATIQDRSGQIQFYINDELTGTDTHGAFKHWDMGDFISAEGNLFKTNKGELSVECNQLRLLSKSLRPLPDKFHGLSDLETKYRQRYVDLIVNPESRNTFKARSKAIASLRRHMLDADFMEVETPMLHPIPGGAAAKPFITHHNALDMQMFLRIAPELYLKRLVVGGFERVFEINRNFRNEGVSPRHNPEFTMMEFYAAYWNHHDLMDFTEAVLRHAARQATGSATLTYSGRPVDLDKPFARLTVTQALVTHADLTPAEATEFLQSLGVTDSGVSALIRGAYHLLGLATYFTAGEKEVRAWTIHAGDTAPKAAGVIHSDFERGFIKAETVAYTDLVNCGTVGVAREKGLYRMEGKEYVVQDGDVMLFKFNV